MLGDKLGERLGLKLGERLGESEGLKDPAATLKLSNVTVVEPLAGLATPKNTLSEVRV